MSETQQLPQLPVSTIKDAQQHLRRPFTAAAVKWKIQTNPKDDAGYALVVGFIDARLASERLNAVCPDLWSEKYKDVEGGLACEITLRETIFSGTMMNAPGGVYTLREKTVQDVGWSKGRAVGMDLKALYSDAFKRAAVKLGVGVSIYAMPQQFLKGGTADLKKLRSGWKITDAGIATLTKKYEAWLKGPGSVFGDPLDHGDAVGSYGDVEAGTPDVAEKAEAKAKAAPKARKISKAGVDAISAFLPNRQGDIINWLVAHGQPSIEQLGELTADEGKALHAFLKEQA